MVSTYFGEIGDALPVLAANPVKRSAWTSWPARETGKRSVDQRPHLAGFHPAHELLTCPLVDSDSLPR
jgi:hypothetical protein